MELWLNSKDLPQHPGFLPVLERSRDRDFDGVDDVPSSRGYGYVAVVDQGGLYNELEVLYRSLLGWRTIKSLDGEWERPSFSGGTGNGAGGGVAGVQVEIGCIDAPCRIAVERDDAGD